MSLCFISSNQESLISSKLLTKQQEEKRKDRENVNRDYRYLLLLGPEKKISACVFLYSHLNSQQKRAGEKSIAACPGLLCIFIWYSPINVATIHSSCLRSLLQFQWTLSPPSFVITLSPHIGGAGADHRANVSMWSNCNLSSGPDYHNHRSSSHFLKFLKV